MPKKDLASALFHLVEAVQELQEAENAKAEKLTLEQLKARSEYQEMLLGKALTALRNSYPKNGGASDLHAHVKGEISTHLLRRSA